MYIMRPGAFDAMNLPLWEASHLLTTLDFEARFPGVLFKSPRHLVNIWGEPHIGAGTSIGAFTEIGDGVVIGTNCRIGAYVFLPPCVTIGNDVFVGPGAFFSNDKYPPSDRADWLQTVVKDGASIGMGAVILPGVSIGAAAKIGAGAVVTKDVPPGECWVGNPARRLPR